jgi:hypothetical protein
MPKVCLDTNSQCTLCGFCQEPLVGKRADAEYCDRDCKRRARQASQNSERIIWDAEFKAKQHAKRTLHRKCISCGEPIKPSYFRSFCPGGTCRRAYEKRIPHSIELPGASVQDMKQAVSFEKRIKARRLHRQEIGFDFVAVTERAQRWIEKRKKMIR